MPPSKTLEKPLDRFVENFYHSLWQFFPSEGSHVGLREFDARLEIPTSELMGERLHLITETKRSIQAIPIPAEGTLEALDRRTFEAHLVLEDLRLGTIQSWRRDPSLAVTQAVDSLFELLMRRDLEDRNTAFALLQRLRAIPDYLRAGQHRITDPTALWAGIAKDSVEGAVAFLREIVPGLTTRHPEFRTDFESAAQKADQSLQSYQTWLGILPEKTLSPEVGVGSDALTAIVKQWHGLDVSLDDLETTGWNLIQYYRDELEQQAKQLRKGASWQELLAEARQRFAQRPIEALAEYKAVTSQLRQRLIEEDLLDLPAGEICEVIATPAFLRALLPTAAYSAPGPLDPHQKGIFFVTEPNPTLSPEAYRANLGQHFGLYATCAHEAYPGHHVQLCSANRTGSLARQLADHIIFMEGWTLYCEQLIVERQWSDDPIFTLQYLADQLWRACRIVIDIGIHTRKMSVAAAISMLVENVGFTRERATIELNWYSQSPGVPMSYLLGKRETLNLKESFLKQRGATLKRFHRWLLGFGSIPQRWMHAHLPTG